jgi:RNA polymerase sigma-70 factor (ECF subfamily)
MTEITDRSDDDLLLRSAAGDEQAFTALYRRRQPGIYRFALHMTASTSIAEEVTQEVFMAAIREGARFDPKRGSAAAFLYGIARNQVLRLIDTRRAFTGLDDASVQSLASTADPGADVTRQEIIQAVRAAIFSLPGVYRETVVLCDLEEMSYQDAADALGVPVGTVRSRLSRGRGLLLHKLKLDVMRCFA